MFSDDFFKTGFTGDTSFFNDLKRGNTSIFDDLKREFTSPVRDFYDNIPHCSCGYDPGCTNGDHFTHFKYTTESRPCDDPLYAWRVYNKSQKQDNGIEELGVLGECATCPKRYTTNPSLQFCTFIEEVPPYCAEIVFHREGDRDPYGKPSEELMKKGREVIKEEGRSALCPLWLDYMKGKCVI